VHTDEAVLSSVWGGVSMCMYAGIDCGSHAWVPPERPGRGRGVGREKVRSHVGTY
jgi:hypothetical protein